MKQVKDTKQTRKQILDLLLYFRSHKEILIRTFRFANRIAINNYLARDDVNESVKCWNGRDSEVLSLHGNVQKEDLLRFVNNLPDDAFVQVDSHEDYDGYTEHRMYAMYIAKEDDSRYLHRLQNIKAMIDAKDPATIKGKVKDADVMDYITSLEDKLGM